MTKQSPTALRSFKNMTHPVETNGYATIASVFSPDEVSVILGWIPDIRGIAGTRNLLELPECVALAADSRIAKLVGADARPVRAILFDKNPSVNWNLGWHQDTKIAVRQRSGVPGFTNWSTKEGITHCQPPVEVLEACIAVRIHLDPCGADNGPLRVIPGSHLSGIQSQVDDSAELRQVSCLAEIGDVVLMKPLLWHASSKAEIPGHRRVIHIKFCSARLPAGLEWEHGPAND